MARPKQCAYEASAKGRIEAAFWRILENEGFHAVTMLRLSQEAGLNRNTVYYHFRHVQELALFAFRHSFTDEASRLFVSVILSGRELPASAAEDAELLSHIKKIHLFARSGSPLLIHILKDSLKRAWFSHMRISGEALTPAEQMQMEYILSGFIGMIGNEACIRHFSMLKTFPHTAMGRAAMRTLQEIAAAQRQDPPPAP